MKKEKSLKELLIELDQINRQLEQVQKPEYIEKVVWEIWTEEKEKELKEKIHNGLDEILAAL